MKASYNWLKEFVDFNTPPDELAHILTMAGFEVEAVEKTGDDTVLDIAVTPNRPDCLSIRGIAREISAVLELPFRDISAELKNMEGEGPVVEIENPGLCHRYSSRTIKGVRPGPSPEWLSRRLESCGIRSMSNIVDVTNYILLETGQPMHAFDLDKLAGKKIVVKQAGNVNKFMTLDGQERALSKDMLLVWDAEKPVAVAGVMGGRDTEVSETTVNILLESAYFNPSSVRRTSRSLGLSSESSYRFERGVDKEAVVLAMDRASDLIMKIAGGRVSHITDRYTEPFRPVTISVSFSRINNVIGIEPEKNVVENILNNLGLKTDTAGDVLNIVPPSYRADLERDIDIIEEVARIYGYGNIPATMPVMQMSPAPQHRLQELVRTLKRSMTGSGFSEVINFSFLNPDMLDKLELTEADKRRKLVHVKNPLRKEDSAMRTTLVPALLNNVNTNLKRGEKMLRFFEISRVFMATGQRLPQEVLQLGAAYHKETTSSIWQSPHDGFYDMKGAFENIFADLKISGISFAGKPQAEPYLHPGKSCSVMIGNEKIGSIGALHPAVAEAFDIKGDITVAELYDISTVLKQIPVKSTYVSLPRFPCVERDAALVVDDSVTVDAVKREILGIGSDIIEAVTLFDIYKGKPIPLEKKSLAFSIRFRSPDRTLTDSEVDGLHSEIISRLRDNLNAELR
ncbi:MAG: phenylalanine--tRNA ligase subunit beta [Nitrospirota bacterium]|nr:phenylalanine--tRNA ligase subunit beta [Nitrospirota bacterium]